MSSDQQGDLSKWVIPVVAFPLLILILILISPFSRLGRKGEIRIKIRI
jgi:hypothetical protein